MKKLKVAVDTLPLTSGHSARGMGMYTKNLIQSLQTVSKNDSSIKIDVISFKENKQELNNYDILHYPYFDLFWHTLPFSKQNKTVVTIPDVIPLIYPKYYPPGIKGRVKFELQKLSLKDVNKVITISETSKKDIVRFLKVEPKKISVTYLAPNFKVHKSGKKEIDKVIQKYNLPKEFILYVGDVNWNKNIIKLCKAAVSLKKVLVIVGKQATQKDYDRQHIENRQLSVLQSKYKDSEYVKRLGFVENEDLEVIWQLASLYCQPSLYEGFGLPVLEAMDAKVPVVASRTQALVEVADKAAIYFDPYDINDMKDKIKEVVESDKLKDILVSEGKRRVRQFSWEKTARETIEVYKSV